MGAYAAGDEAKIAVVASVVWALCSIAFVMYKGATQRKTYRITSAGSIKYLLTLNGIVACEYSCRSRVCM